jgi:hypothetical protein
MTQLKIIDNEKPYFIQVLEYGIKNNLILEERKNKIKDEGISYSVLFCKKYFRSIYVTDIKQAVSNIISIISLALYKESKGNINKASSILNSYSFDEIYQLGKKKIDEYFELLKKISLFSGSDVSYNNAMVEIFPSYYNTHINSIVKFNDAMYIANNELNDIEYYKYLKEMFYPFDTQEYITGIYFTPLLSLVVDSLNPKGLLSRNDLNLIHNRIKSEDNFINNLEQKAKEFKQQIVPEKFEKIFDNNLAEFLKVMESTLIPIIEKGDYKINSETLNLDYIDPNEDISSYIELDISSFL